MKKYSILLLYPDYMASDYPFETYWTWIEAKNPESAKLAAQIEAYIANDGPNGPVDSAADFKLLGIIEGWHKLLGGDL